MLWKIIGLVIGTFIAAIIINLALNFASLLLPWRVISIVSALVLIVLLIRLIRQML